MDKKLFLVSEIDEFIRKCLSLQGILSLDVEASSLNTRSSEFYLGGIGFSNKDTGYYLLINSLEIQSELSQSDNEKLVELFKTLESRTKLLVFNKAYEISVIDHMFNHSLNVLDVLIMATGLGKRASLKDLSRQYLDLDSEQWEKNIKSFVDSMTKLLKSYVSKNGKANKHFESLKQQLEQMRESNEYKLPEVKLKGQIESFENISRIIEEESLNSEEFIPVFLNRIVELAEKGIDEANYCMIPSKMVAEYCIYDCINTVNLFYAMLEEFKEKGTKESFQNYDDQTTLSILFEKNSYVWDEELAKSNIEFLTNKLLGHLKPLCLNENVSELLEITEQQKLDIAVSSDVEFLNEFINPRSVKTKRAINAAILNDRVRFCLFLKIVSYDSKRKRNIRFVKPFMKYLSLEITNVEQIDSAIELFKNDLTSGSVKVNDTQMSYVVTNFKRLTLDKDLYREEFNEEVPRTWTDLGIGDFNKDTIATLYSVFEKNYGINFDSSEEEIGVICDTYSEFSFYYNLSMCKKVAKEISGYDSKLGRDNVFVGNEDGSNGVSYYTNPNAENYRYVAKFNPVSTDTKRWKSGCMLATRQSDLQKYKNPRIAGIPLEL